METSGAYLPKGFELTRSHRQLGQILVNKSNCHAAFAYTGGDPLDRSMPYIPCCEDARHAGFQQVWIAARIPFPESSCLEAGHEIAALIIGDGLRQPVRLRIRPDEDKQRVCRATLGFGVVRAGLPAERNRFQMFLSLHLVDEGIQLNPNVRLSRKLCNEVL